MNKNYRTDYQFGDLCLLNVGSAGKSLCVVRGVDDSSESIALTAKDSRNEGWYEMSDCERLPRTGELIEAKQYPNDEWLNKRVLLVDHDTLEITTLNSDYKYSLWRFKDAGNKVYELVKKIEENDKEVLSELAEIILAARESHKK